MRWIFFCLVILSVAVLILYWGKQQQPQANNEPVVMASGQRLTLTSEATVALPRITRQPEAQAVAQQRCFLLGPYQDIVDANYARARAEALGVAGSTQTTQLPTQEAKEFWVFVPPRASREEARKVLRELQQRKVDSYIINAGELAEGISLGLFRKEESAQQVADKVKTYNIPVEVRIKNDIKEEHWLEVNASPEFGERLRQRILADDRDVAWQMTDCQE